MLRVLPLIDIHGKQFIVDVAKTEIRQLGEPQNTISFNDMIDCGNQYTFLYDTRLQGTPRADSQDPSSFVQINIPSMVQLDPVGMAEKYGKTVEEIKGKTDFEVMVDPKLLEKRLGGKLPLIDIAGNTYIIDLRLKELRLESDPFNRINLRNLEFSSDGEHYQFYYNSSSKQALTTSPSLSPYQDGISFIEIPNDLGLDPVQVAREYKIDTNDLLRRYPIQKDLKAKVTPLTKELYKTLLSRLRNPSKASLKQKAKSKKI